MADVRKIKCRACKKYQTTDFYDLMFTKKKDGGDIWKNICKACIALPKDKKPPREYIKATKVESKINKKFLVRGTISDIGTQGAFGGS